MTLNDLKNYSQDDLLRLYALLKSDYEAFATMIMGHIVRDVPKYQHELFQILNRRYEHNGIVLFRGSGKSTSSKTIQVTADMCFAREPFTCLISESVDQASKDLVSVVDELENNELINALFGSLKGPLWNQEEIETINGCFVKCRGYGSRIRGLKWKTNRITKMILDDYESESNTGTAKQRDNVKSWIDAQVLPAGEPRRTTFQFFGTIVHPDAHLATIKNLPQFQPPHGIYLEVPIETKGVSAWPSRFDMDYIRMKEKEYAAKNRLALWLQEMYHIPAVQGAPRFNVDLIKETAGIFRNVNRVTYVERGADKIPINVFIGVDPASSLSEKADNSVFFVMGQYPDKSFVILDIMVDKLTPYQQAKKIFELVNKYDPVFVTIETQGYQGALPDICREMMYQGSTPFTIREFKSNQSKSNKWLLGLDPHINTGKVSVVQGCNNFDVFKRELLCYNEDYREHDDTIDGAFLAILNAYPPAMFNVDEAINQVKKKRKSSKLNWMTM